MLKLLFYKEKKQGQAFWTAVQSDAAFIFWRQFRSTKEGIKETTAPFIKVTRWYGSALARGTLPSLHM